MGATLEKRGDVTVVTLADDYLDVSNVKDFKREMQALSAGSRQVVLDLSAVQFVDSSGCGAILRCLRELNRGGGDLKLCRISRQVRALFEVVRLHRVVEIYNDRDEAVRAFATRSPDKT